MGMANPIPEKPPRRPGSFSSPTMIAVLMADHLAPQVDQRSTGIALVDRCIGNDEVFVPRDPEPFLCNR